MSAADFPGLIVNGMVWVLLAPILFTIFISLLVAAYKALKPTRINAEAQESEGAFSAREIELIDGMRSA